MPELKVPSNLAGAFRSSLPVAEDLRLEGVNDWGGSLVDTSARWSQMAMARIWERGVVAVPPQAQELLDAAWSAVDAVQTWEQAELGTKLASIAQGGLAALDAMYSAMGIVEAVPLIGNIAKIGISIQRTFWNAWFRSKTRPPADPGLRYDLNSDERFQQDALSAIETGDLTTIFLPRVKVEGFEAREVQHPTHKNERQWLVVPQGPVLGLGCVPGALSIARMWQGPTASSWGDYRPGALAACDAAWQLVRTSMRDHIDVGRIKSEWMFFWASVQKQRNEWSGEHRGTVLERALNPLRMDRDAPGFGTPIYPGKTMLQVTGQVVDAIDVKVSKFAVPGAPTRAGSSGGGLLLTGAVAVAAFLALR